ALTLRQGIWRKDQADWPICGIPRIFYTDHGSDFTSQHLEQVSADLKIELKFSKVGVPRGRGKIERFFHTVNSMLLQDLPGYIKNRKAKSMLTLEEFSDIFRNWLLRIYHQKQHSTTKEKPIAMWNNYDFLPNMPNSLEDLDLLLIKVKKERVVHSDGIHLFGMKYVHPTLSAFVSEPVVIRYDPRDIS
ncbi:Mu transposase C-terminal domain-containing protein, partial [Listeria monocytogenes]|uniref:Mu transposase C-terminal domain-containing protein n=1 Tax=Listeria monocytogenes TaxID=1639 RepID=UPI00117A8EA8